MQFPRLLPMGLLILAVALRAQAEDAPAPQPAASQATASQSDAPQSDATAVYRQHVEPLLKQYCQACHSGAEPKSELSLDEPLQRADVLKDRQAWEQIAKKIHEREMPPEGEPQPTDAQRATIAGWLDGELAKFDCGREREPGRVTLRRLNRNEYNNTIRDLLGVDFKPAEEFPSDDVGYGFDHIGDVLSMPPILLEKYLSAAQKIVDRALGTEQVNLVTEEVQGGLVQDGGSRILASQLEVRTSVRLPGRGDYMVRVRAYGEQAGDEPVKMGVYFDNNTLRIFDVRAVEGEPQLYEAWVSNQGGKHAVSVVFLNDYYRPDLPGPHDRNLILEDLQVMGPYPPTYRQLIPREHTPEDRRLLAHEILSGFVSRAFRRPATAAEIDRLMKLVELAERDGDTFGGAIGLAVQAVLVSPHFLFRIEQDPDLAKAERVRTLDDFELATRLSYFLWSTMPDEELFTLARLHRLRQGDTLEQQVRRMLADPKAQALVENFAGQWLQLRSLKTATPDKQTYPEFDEALRDAMQQETELFFAAVMREDRSLLDFIDADFTFVNERLARHYGLPDIKGKEFRRVTLDGQQRGGVLTHASVLTVTSNPTRTSPVKRGKWVLDNLLGTPPPPPPPDVPPLVEEAGTMLTGSLRERMQQHRAKTECAVCHNRMDPLGFGLENYDGVGRWRTMDGPFSIDPSGVLPNGQAFAGPRELKAVLKSRQDDFIRCLAERMLTYGLGRGVEYSDQCTVQDLCQALQANDYKFSSLILAIVRSDSFQKRSRGSDP